MSALREQIPGTFWNSLWLIFIFLHLGKPIVVSSFLGITDFHSLQLWLIFSIERVCHLFRCLFIIFEEEKIFYRSLDLTTCTDMYSLFGSINALAGALESVGLSAEHLLTRCQLHVYFESDNRMIIVKHTLVFAKPLSVRSCYVFGELVLIFSKYWLECPFSVTVVPFNAVPVVVSECFAFWRILTSSTNFQLPRLFEQ